METDCTLSAERRVGMAECKYPNEVCANMTVLNGNTYCDSIPCSLKDEMLNQNSRKGKMSKEEILKQLKDRKSSWEKLLTRNSNNVIDVDLEIGIRINELDEVIKLFE